MTFEEARDLVLQEGLGESGLPVCARMGEDPGSARMKAITDAVRVVFDGLRGQTAIERRLAYALFGIGYYMDTQISSWIAKGRSFREDLFDPEVLQLTMAIESVFCDEWAPFADNGE